MNLVGMTTRKSGPACLVLEYLPHGSLQTFLGHLREGPIPEWYLRFTRDTLRGAYHKHVSGDLMSVLEQVAAGMVSLLVIIALVCVCRFLDWHMCVDSQI